MATTESGDQHFYYNQDSQFQAQNLSTFKKNVRTSQRSTDGYENVPNPHSPLANGMNNDDDFDKTTEYLASLHLPDASTENKRDSDKGRRFSWGKNKKSVIKDKSYHNGGRLSYDDKRLALNDSDDENLVPLRGASYWACCVSSRVQKMRSRRRDDKTSGLPDGFTGTSNVTDPPQFPLKVNIFHPPTTNDDSTSYNNTSLQKPTNNGQRMSPQIQTNGGRMDDSTDPRSKVVVRLPDVQRDRLNSSQNHNDSLRKMQVTPGIAPPTIEKDFSLPPFGAIDNYGSLQYPSYKNNNRESSGASFVPSPDPSPSTYQEIPASQPDLNKRPAKSALKGSKNPASLNRLSDSSSANSRTSDGSGGPEPAPRGSKSASKGGIKFGAAQEQGVNPSSFKNHGFPQRNMVMGMPIQEEDDDDEDDEEEEDNPEYDNPSTDDSDDGDVRYSDRPSGLGAKVARNDSLAKFLSTKAERQRTNLPQDCNVIPQRTPEERQELRQRIGSQLNRRLSQRPTAQELEEKHILLRQTPEQIQRDREEIKKTLIRKLSFRPTIGELKERRIIKFSDYIESTLAEEYDRSCDKPWTKLTQRDKALIRKELNEFKSTEMEVHESSRQYTRFHAP